MPLEVKTVRVDLEHWYRVYAGELAPGARELVDKAVKDVQARFEENGHRADDGRPEQDLIAAITRYWTISNLRAEGRGQP